MALYYQILAAGAVGYCLWFSLAVLGVLPVVPLIGAALAGACIVGWLLIRVARA